MSKDIDAGVPIDGSLDEKNSPSMLPEDRGDVPYLSSTQPDPVVLEEGDAPLGKVTASLSDYFTLLASGFGKLLPHDVKSATRLTRPALVSDGFQNNLPSFFNLAFKKLYPKVYTSAVQTRVSNSLLVGEVIGQLVVGCEWTHK